MKFEEETEEAAGNDSLALSADPQRSILQFRDPELGNIRLDAEACPQVP